MWGVKVVASKRSRLRRHKRGEGKKIICQSELIHQIPVMLSGSMKMWDTGSSRLEPESRDLVLICNETANLINKTWSSNVLKTQCGRRHGVCSNGEVYEKHCRHKYVAVLFLWMVKTGRAERRFCLDWSKRMNNSRAASRHEHLVCLRKPAGILQTSH